MKLHNVKDVSGLMHLLDNAKGAVSVTTADGTEFDWVSQNGVVRAMLTSLGVYGVREMSLRFAKRSDANDVLNFLMGCTRTMARTA